VGIRRVVSQSLVRTLGPERARRVRHAEVGLRSRLIAAMDVEGNHVSRQARKPSATTEPLSRAELIDAIGRQSPEGVSHRTEKSLPWASADPTAKFPKATWTRHQLLAGLHEQLRPRTYFEIGIDVGNSLAQSRTTSIGVDPAYTITAELHCNVRTFRETSDNFFGRADGLDHFDGLPIELAFIDGMHLAEFVLRDFMNTEKRMSPGGVVIIDDMLPRNSLEAFRIRRTRGWTGDIYKVHQVLVTYRPDLTLVPISTYPTGSYMVVGLDPTNTVLDDHYTDIESDLKSPDPQTVPQTSLERRDAVDADRVLGLNIWNELATLHHEHATPTREQVAPMWEQLRQLPTIWQ